MEYKPLNERKKEFDDVLMKYFAKRIFDDIDETNAYEEDIIDSVGNIVKETDDNWAFTHFDKLILALKNSVGKQYLRNLLSAYQYMKDIDPLFIMNMSKNTDLPNVRKHLGMIVTKIEDSSYLPEKTEHSEEHIEEGDLSFCDRVSRALTVGTFLLYTLRNDRIPSEIDFDRNVAPSVEITFNITPCKKYEKCVDFCKENGLIESSIISNEGMRKLVSISKCIVTGNLLSKKTKRVENQSHNWENLSKINKS